MDYKKMSFTQPYCGLFHELAQNMNHSIKPQFPYSWFDSGYAFYLFNCERDHGKNTDDIDKTSVGSIEISGSFAEPPIQNLIFIVMLSFENSYEIDIHRNVTFKEQYTKNSKTKGIKRYKK